MADSLFSPEQLAAIQNMIVAAIKTVNISALIRAIPSLLDKESALNIPFFYSDMLFLLYQDDKIY